MKDFDEIVCAVLKDKGIEVPEEDVEEEHIILDIEEDAKSGTTFNELSSF